jgi:hypothetical protein
LLFPQLNQQSHSESEVKEDDDHETEAANAPEEADDALESLRRKRKKKKKKKKKPEFKSCSNHISSEDNLKVLDLCLLYFVAVRCT